MSDAIGFVCIGISCLFWGSNFVPVKQFPTGNGAYYQWIMAMGIWLVGLIVYLIRGCPEFVPIMLVGGFCWATGNMMTVTIVRLIGLGLGMLVWGTSCLLMGWASGTFGLFGIKEQTVPNPVLNYIGVVVAVIGGMSFVFVKPTLENRQESLPEEEEEEKGKGRRSGGGGRRLSRFHSDEEDTSNSDEEKAYIFDRITTSAPVTLRERSKFKRQILSLVHMEDFDKKRHLMMHYFHLDAMNLSHKVEKKEGHCLPITGFDLEGMNPWKKRAVGFLMAVAAGLLYGVNFNPAQYYMDNHAGASRDGVDYVFPHFCGIMLASSFYFVIYGVLARNKPEMFPEVTLPALASGAMWAIAQTCFFIANARLSMTIAFPISTIGPGVVASLWSVLLFHEIRGRSNFIALFLAFSTCLLAISLITLSSI